MGESDVLTHDTTAFVEEISVPKPDRRADKLRRLAANAELEVVHVSVELSLAEDALRRLEQRRGEQAPRVFGLGLRRSAAAREGGARDMVADLRDRLTAERARATELEQQAREHEAVRPRNVSYRLHSAEHHATYSESRFERMSRTQRTRPVLVTSLGGLSWWWYLDRFWWDDEGIGAADVRAIVHQRDRESVRQHGSERRALALAGGDTPPALTVAELAIPDDVRRAVWRRDFGLCARCGDDRDLVFDVIHPISRGGSMEPSNVELRCGACHASARSENGARTGLRDRPGRPIS